MRANFSRAILVTVSVALLTLGTHKTTTAQEPASQATVTSADETWTWIQDRITRFGRATKFDRDGKVIASKTCQAVSRNGCELVLRDELVLPTYRQQIEFTVPLDALDPSRVEAKQGGEPLPFWYVTLRTTGDARRVSMKVLSFDNSKAKGIVPGDSVEASVSIPCADRETAERLAKAFVHFITLCGGKREPF
jgi:hypothetical protein